MHQHRCRCSDSSIRTQKPTAVFHDLYTEIVALAAKWPQACKYILTPITEMQDDRVWAKTAKSMHYLTSTMIWQLCSKTIDTTYLRNLRVIYDKTCKLWCDSKKGIRIPSVTIGESREMSQMGTRSRRKCHKVLKSTSTQFNMRSTEVKAWLLMPRQMLSLLS